MRLLDFTMVVVATCTRPIECMHNNVSFPLIISFIYVHLSSSSITKVHNPLAMPKKSGSYSHPFLCLCRSFHHTWAYSTCWQVAVSSTALQGSHPISLSTSASRSIIADLDGIGISEDDLMGVKVSYRVHPMIFGPGLLLLLFLFGHTSILV